MYFSIAYINYNDVNVKLCKMLDFNISTEVKFGVPLIFFNYYNYLSDEAILFIAKNNIKFYDMDGDLISIDEYTGSNNKND